MLQEWLSCFSTNALHLVTFLSRSFTDISKGNYPFNTPPQKTSTVIKSRVQGGKIIISPLLKLSVSYKLSVLEGIMKYASYNLFQSTLFPHTHTHTQQNVPQDDEIFKNTVPLYIRNFTWHIRNISVGNMA